MSFEKTLESPVPPRKDVKHRFSGVTRGKMPQDGMSKSAAEGSVPSFPVADTTAPRKGGDSQTPDMPAAGPEVVQTPRMSEKFKVSDPTR